MKTIEVDGKVYKKLGTAIAGDIEDRDALCVGYLHLVPHIQMAKFFSDFLPVILAEEVAPVVEVVQTRQSEHNNRKDSFCSGYIGHHAVAVVRMDGKEWTDDQVDTIREFAEQLLEDGEKRSTDTSHCRSGDDSKRRNGHRQQVPR